MGSAPRQVDKKLLVKLGIVGLLLCVVALLSLQGFDWKMIIAETLRVIREAGPWAFFGGMAILPAFGFPLAPFTLTAGSAFSATLGLPLVLVATCAAIAVNVMLSYVLARWLFRPVLARLVVRLGYRMPEIRPDNQWDVSILLRVTPGPPFFVQSYLLGLGRVPVRVYLIVSLAVAWSFAAAFVLFGDALLHGRGRMAMLGLSLIACIGAGTHFLRKHLARKKAAAAV